MSAEKKYRKKKRLGSYPFVSVIFSMTLALFVLGLFGTLLITTNSLTDLIKNNVEMQVYLQSGLSDNEITRINKSMALQPYILQEAENNGVRFVSKEEAAKLFIDRTGEDFMKFLGDNPLKDALIITIHPDYHTNDKMNAIQKEIEGMSGVFEVVYVANMIQSINENVTKISIALLALAIILLIVILILINNTIKLALFSQRFLIRSMQLVGATNSFIRSPFIYRSAIHGLIAGIFSSALLYGLNLYASDKLPGFNQLLNNQFIFMVYGCLLIFGMLIGIIATYKAIQKYLAMSLEELY